MVSYEYYIELDDGYWIPAVFHDLELEDYAWIVVPSDNFNTVLNIWSHK